MDIDTSWERVTQRAGLVNFHFHDLRHSCASYPAMSGASLLEIANILGHKSLQMVQCYAHLSDAHTSGVVERMAGQFLDQPGRGTEVPGRDV